MSGPSSSRRSLLKGLAFLTAGSAAAITATAAVAESHSDAELLALGSELDQAVARYRDLKDAMERAIARFVAIKPSIPDDLHMRGFVGGWVATEWPPDHLGRCNAGRVQNSIRIPNRQSLDARVKELDGRTALGRKARRLKKLSDAFHEAHIAAREEAGVNKIDRARYDQGVIVANLNVRIAGIRATTLAGLAVKGRSELAWLAVDLDDGGLRQRKGIVALFENLAALGPAT